MRVLLLERSVLSPLIERCGDVVTANVKHGLGVSTAGLLQAPRRRVVEVEATSARARVPLLEIVASLEAGIGFKLSVERVATTVEVTGLLGQVPVVNGIA